MPPVKSCGQCHQTYDYDELDDARHTYRIGQGTGHSESMVCLAVRCPAGHEIDHVCDESGDLVRRMLRVYE